MAKRLTRYILIALVLGVVVGWIVNASIDDGTRESAARNDSVPMRIWTSPRSARNVALSIFRGAGQ